MPWKELLYKETMNFQSQTATPDLHMPGPVILHS